MAVPLIDMAPQHQALLGEFQMAFEQVVGSGQFILGPCVEAFEKKLAEYCGVRHAIGVSSGTDALLLAMMAMGIKPGDEVIVPTFTFFATAGCVARLGARPVFVDVDPVTYNLDPARIDQVITSRTRAIMPVHLFGQCAEMNAINAIARRNGIKVIEDACQAIGARDGDKAAGALGAVGCLSFYPTKNLAALGDAGACTTDDDELAKRMKILRLHGQTGEYQHDFVGGNFRIDALQCAMLSIKLPHLDHWGQQRGENACRYHGLLRGLPIGLPNASAGKRHVYNQYTIRVLHGKRDALKAHLASKKIGCRVYYPLPLHLQPCFAYLGNKAGDFPVSEQAAREVLSLPIYPEMTAAQQEEAAAAIREFFM
jgi:dTDP-4-amino-4,6-dideoxygalactose transaminase